MQCFSSVFLMKSLLLVNDPYIFLMISEFVMVPRLIVIVPELVMTPSLFTVPAIAKTMLEKTELSTVNE